MLEKLYERQNTILDNKLFIEAQDAGLYIWRFAFMATVSALRL